MWRVADMCCCQKIITLKKTNMKIKPTFFKKILSLAIVCICITIGNVYAQVPTFITPGGTSNNSFPFRTTSSNKVQWLYLPTDFSPNLQGGAITHVYFRTANQVSSTLTLTDLRISIGHENPTVTVWPNTTFKTGLTVCYGVTTTTITTAANGWWGVKLDVPFVYDGTSNLVIEATVVGNCGLQTNQNSTNGDKRIWGGRTATSGSKGTGQAATGLEIITCNANVTTQPKDVTICPNNNTSFSITATNANTYRWQVSTNNGVTWTNINNTAIYSGATTTKLNITAAPVSMDNYQYRCAATNTANACTVNSESATLNFSTSADITTNPSNKTICNLNNTSFSISANNAAAYSWELSTNGGTTWTNVSNGVLYSNANTPTLNITGATTSMSNYRYRCKLTSICGVSTNTNTAVLTVLPIATTGVSISATSTNICFGTSVTFTPTPQNGGSSPSYQWKLNGSNVSTGSTYSTSSLADNDEITCVMTSSLQCVDNSTISSNTVKMTVHPTVSPDISITSDVANVWCMGMPNVFRSAIQHGGSQPSYQWTLNGTNVGFDTDTLYLPNMQDGDEIECTLTSNAQCRNTNTEISNTIKMNIIPTTRSSVVIAANPSTTICENDQVTFYTSFTNGGSTPGYQWAINGIDIPGETNATLTTNAINDNDAVTCTFISSNTCVFPEQSNSISFDVDNKLTPSVDMSVTYNGNNSYTFTAIPVNGGNNPHYQWYKNNLPLSGENGSTYTTTASGSVDKIYVQMASKLKCIAPSYEVVTSRTATTGVDDIITTINNLSIHPNPNTGSFTITGKLNNTSEAGSAIVKITNALGQVVYNQTSTINTQELKIPVSLNDNISNGIYMINITIDNNHTTMRFVLNR